MSRLGEGAQRNNRPGIAVYLTHISGVNFNFYLWTEMKAD